MPFDLGFAIEQAKGNAIIPWMVVILLGLWILRDFVKNIPIFLKLKALIYRPLARWLKFKWLQKEAIKSDVEGTVNYAVRPILKELPNGSMKRLEVEYVNNVEVESFIREGKILVRVMPVENSTNNFMNIIQLYLELTLIPDSKKFLSPQQIKSVTYFTTHRLIKGRKSLVDTLHEDYFLPDTKRYPKLQEYFDKIGTVDNRGLFFSVLVRTMERGASTLRFSKGNLQQEFDKVLEHLLNFIADLNKKPEEKDPNVWTYSHANISFAILLVAHPLKAITLPPASYLKRFKDDLNKADWVFVVFSDQEINYGQRVAEVIEATGEVELVDTSESLKDYRGKPGGIVKLYVKKDKLSRY